MKDKPAKAPAYNWKEVKAKILNGVTYPTGFPFNYRFQLRLKVAPSSISYTFWDFSKCIYSGTFEGQEAAVWDQLMEQLQRKGILDIGCVGVGISVWNDLQVILRMENNPAVALDVVNRGLRTQPESIRKDLQANGIYGFTAMECDSNKLFIFGLPLGYTLKSNITKFPAAWAKAVWSGPTAIPMWHVFTTKAQENLYHTVLLKNMAISIMTQGGKMRFLQQDKGLVEDQPVTQGALTRLRNVYNYFMPGEVTHLIHPVGVSLAWANNLRTSILEMKVAADVQIVPPAKLKLPGVGEDVLLQDMFPTGLPWS